MKRHKRMQRTKPESTDDLKKLLDQSKTKTKAFEKMLRFLESLDDSHEGKNDKTKKKQNTDN
jgi:hypothetical protein